MKYLAFSASIVIAFVVTPYLFFGVPSTATAYGISLVSAESAGMALAALGLGALGLLYKPNRFAGFVIGTLISTGLIVSGANAQAACQFNGSDVRLCDLSDKWYPVVPQSHASAEFRRDDGFVGQLIIDTAGFEQGITLAAAADAVLQNVRASSGVSDLNLLLRGVNQGLRDSEILVYQVSLQGLPFVFANTIYVGRRETIQLITWRISDELEEADRSAHQDFGRGLVLMPSF